MLIEADNIRKSIEGVMGIGEETAFSKGYDQGLKAALRIIRFEEILTKDSQQSAESNSEVKTND